MKRLAWLILSGAAMLAACGSAPPPTEALAGAEAAIRGASEAGATQIPRAQLHLKLAEEQTEKAKRFLQDGYNERATLALNRARADAELAIAIAREHQALEDLQQAQQKLDQAKGQAK